MKIALIQMNAGPDIQANLIYVEQKIREAVSQGASFIATPENTDFMADTSQKKISLAYDEANHPFLLSLPKLARDLKVFILIGSLAVKSDGEKLYNRSYLIADDGQILTSYDKIHLFDVDLPNGEKRRESDTMIGGECAKLLRTSLGTIGLSICYDVRFPHLYRELAKRGAEILAIPAAFTVPTGELHWEVLLRARAIENGAYVIAPAQCGMHDGGRKTYGHSMIIDPWGKILAKATTEPTIIYAEIDRGEVQRFRESIPSLKNERLFSISNH
jgi:predicted amidohydrolase